MHVDEAKAASETPELTESEQNSRVYLQVVRSFNVGVERLLLSRHALVNLMLARVNLPGKAEGVPVNDEYAEAVAALRRVTSNDFTALDYVTNITDVVYATTLFDSFLADTTRFMLLLHPKSVGKGATVTLADLLSSASKTDLVNEVVGRKAREISFMSFGGRIDWLRQSFGLRLEVPREAFEYLEKSSSVRNLVVHDQSTVDIYFDGARVSVRRKGEVKYPTPIDTADVTKTRRTYQVTAYAIALVILHQVLGAEQHDGVRSALAWLKDLSERETATLLEP
jgi:hypothetical protein